MKHFNFLLLMIFSFAYAQEPIQVSSDITFPTSFNNDGTALFFLNWESENNGFIWEDGEINGFSGGKAYDFSFGANRLIGAVSETHGEIEAFVAAYYDTETEQWTSLGIDENIPVTNDSYSSAWGANYEGDKFVGLIFSSAFEAEAFVWTQETGYQILPNSSESNIGSRANGISEHGDVIFGHIVKPNGVWNPCVWIDNEIIMIDDSDNFGDASCASFDGTYVVASNYGNLYIWSEDEMDSISASMEELENVGLPDGELLASAISDDKTVFGFVNGIGTRESFVYSEENGLQSFNTYLENIGITGLENFTFSSTIATTPDKSVLSGSGFDENFQYATYIIYSTMGVNDASNKLNYMIYPTLVDDVVNINHSVTTEKMRFTLTNANGQIVFEKTGTSLNNSESISMVQYPKGIYFLTVQQGNNAKTTKLIKR